MNKRPKGFVTVVETVYHQAVDSQPTGEPRNHSIPVYTDQQPFERTLLLSGQWKTLRELGCWLEECSLVVIVNIEGSTLQRNPTPDERQRIEDAVVHLSYGIVVRPGRSCRIEPQNMSELRLRCASDKALVKIAVYPV